VPLNLGTHCVQAHPVRTPPFKKRLIETRKVSDEVLDNINEDFKCTVNSNKFQVHSFGRLDEDPE
jgi:hypothetical protein